jgi:hypothetical protein
MRIYHYKPSAPTHPRQQTDIVKAALGQATRLRYTLARYLSYRGIEIPVSQPVRHVFRRCTLQSIILYGFLFN